MRRTPPQSSTTPDTGIAAPRTAIFSRPVRVSDELVSSIQVREATVADHPAAQKIAEGDLGEADIVLHALVCGVDPQVIRRLPMHAFLSIKLDTNSFLA
jgi:hypothetical protein